MLLRGATRTTAQKWLCRIARHAKRGISQICGIDEAGRGAVLGPLVVCGFSAAENLQAELKLMGSLLYVLVVLRCANKCVVHAISGRVIIER